MNNSSVSKTVNLDFGSDTIRNNYYWYEVYANNETDKKIFVNEEVLPAVKYMFEIFIAHMLLGITL